MPIVPTTYRGGSHNVQRTTKAVRNRGHELKLCVVTSPRAVRELSVVNEALELADVGIRVVEKGLHVGLFALRILTVARKQSRAHR